MKAATSKGPLLVMKEPLDPHILRDIALRYLSEEPWDPRSLPPAEGKAPNIPTASVPAI